MGNQEWHPNLCAGAAAAVVAAGAAETATWTENQSRYQESNAVAASPAQTTSLTVAQRPAKASLTVAAVVAVGVAGEAKGRFPWHVTWLLLSSACPPLLY